MLKLVEAVFRPPCIFLNMSNLFVFLTEKYKQELNLL